MKKILCLITILSAIISVSACKASCDKCDKLTELKAEADELKEFLDNYDLTYEGSAEQLNAEERYKSVQDQIVVLAQHECALPPEKVENVEYKMGIYEGTYTGEMKSGVPHGKGTFIGVDSYNSTLKYEGDYVGGKIDGYGIYARKSADGNTGLYYEGEFSDNHFVGEGFMCRIYPEEISEKKGKWENDQLVTGEYKTSDKYGNILDYGTYENGKLTYSARDEEIKRWNKEVEIESRKKAYEFYSDIFEEFFKF